MQMHLQRISKRIRKRSRMGQSVVPTKKKKSKIVDDSTTNLSVEIKRKGAPTKTTVLAKKTNVGRKNLKITDVKKNSPVKKKVAAEKKEPQQRKKTEKKGATPVKMTKKIVAKSEMHKQEKKLKKDAKNVANSTNLSDKALKKLKKVDNSEATVKNQSVDHVKQEVLNNTCSQKNKPRGRVAKEPKNCVKKPKIENIEVAKQIKATAVKRLKSPQPKTDTQPKECVEKLEKHKKIAEVSTKEKKLDNKAKKDDKVKGKLEITKLTKLNSSKTVTNDTKCKNNTLKTKEVPAAPVKTKLESNSNHKVLKETSNATVKPKTEKNDKSQKSEIKLIKKDTGGSSVKPKKRKIKVEESDGSSFSDELTLDLLRHPDAKATTQTPKSTTKKVKVKVEPISDTEHKLSSGRKPKVLKRVLNAKSVNTKPKMMLMKKRVLAKDKSKEDQKMHRMKLFGFWTGPKRHRVASLNALAKVHCLYENESRGAMLDNMDTFKAETIKEPKDEKPKPLKVEKTEKTEEPPKRNLRTAPGLRGAGKHWDMHDTSSTESSSEDSNDSTYQCPNRLLVPPPSYKQKMEKQEAAKKSDAPPAKRRRNRTEIIMDLKDMVVRKRMASLNASAILAASYSVEKRAVKSPKTEDTDETTAGEDSSDVSYKKDTKKKCYEADVKSDDEVSKVCVTPNKKVAVILNQDTDVTITGVYVNSTRSTHHEGYCSIAGMQYRISATSHTQTAATAVATETLLHSTGSNTEQVGFQCFMSTFIQSQLSTD